MKRSTSSVSESLRQRPAAVELPIGSSPLGSDDGCLEATVVVEPGERPYVRLTQLGWGAGVGWYAQHSLDLSLDEAHELARLLDKAPRSPASEAAPTAPVMLAEYRDRKAGRSQPHPDEHASGCLQAQSPLDDC